MKKNQLFAVHSNDPLKLAIQDILLNEDLTSVLSKVENLSVGDVTNFGVVTKIDQNSASFKAKDTGVSKILFKQRKIGSNEFVLDKLTILTKKESVDENSNLIKDDLVGSSENEQKFKQMTDLVNVDRLVLVTKPSGAIPKAIIDELGKDYIDKFTSIHESALSIKNVLDSIAKDLYQKA